MSNNKHPNMTLCIDVLKNGSCKKRKKEKKMTILETLLINKMLYLGKSYI